MSGTTGTASTVAALSPAEEKKADKDRLLTALINVCGVPCARCKDHPIVLALKHKGIALFHADFIHMTAADINALQHDKDGTLVPLELNFIGCITDDRQTHSATRTCLTNTPRDAEPF